MPDAEYDVGEGFMVQFVWRIPSGDFLRALFRAEVLQRDFVSDKYVVELKEWLAGRQEDEQGATRTAEEAAHDYWQRVSELEGQKVSLAFEAQDGRALWLRLETLTGEHNFFRRLNELPPALQAKLERDEPDKERNDD
ncbi:MAG: hypothetical protein R3300_07965 [Candidatus Promineifilaceae bacterium]|nr:hypothetical protein [Candidatus Promineifilaceae bacterium]